MDGPHEGTCAACGEPGLVGDDGRCGACARKALLAELQSSEQAARVVRDADAKPRRNTGPLPRAKTGELPPLPGPPARRGTGALPTPAPAPGWRDKLTGWRKWPPKYVAAAGFGLIVALNGLFWWLDAAPAPSPEIAAHRRLSMVSNVVIQAIAAGAKRPRTPAEVVALVRAADFDPPAIVEAGTRRPGAVTMHVDHGRVTFGATLDDGKPLLENGGPVQVQVP